MPCELNPWTNKLLYSKVAEIAKHLSTLHYIHQWHYASTKFVIYQSLTNALRGNCRHRAQFISSVVFTSSETGKNKTKQIVLILLKVHLNRFRYYYKTQGTLISRFFLFSFFLNFHSLVLFFNSYYNFLLLLLWNNLQKPQWLFPQ